MILIRGNNCLYPCPVCLVPNELLSDLNTEWPLRTVEEAQEALQYTTAEERKEATKALGIRPIWVKFKI